MKIPYIPLMILAGVSVMCGSCVSTPSVGYASYDFPGTISSSVAWTNASYDASGFPIFGYSYGRPVYGYTPSGVAVTTLAALTALCYVPHWKPASWYRGTHRYPHGIHRVPVPPKFPKGHRPGIRPPMPPQGGMHHNFEHHGTPVPPPGFNHGISTMPAPVGTRIAPVPRVGGVGIPKPVTPAGGVHNFSTMPAPVGTRIAPVPGAVHHVAPAGGVRNFSTMPAPTGRRIAPSPRVAPHVAPAPGVGGVSIPKPTTPTGGARNFSTMPAPTGRHIAPSPKATPHVAPRNNSGGVSTMHGSAPTPIIRR